MSGPRKKPNSGKQHVFLKNCSSGTDQRLLDADFDRYWDDESKNNNRNRIRVGRQYQATVPPLLKPGEADGRRCEDLETLKWKPDQEISDEQLDNYLSVVKAVSLFAKAINICQNPDSETGKCLQNALRGLSEFVTSHHPKESKSGCQVSPPGGGGGDQQSSCASGGSAALSQVAPSGAEQQNHSPGWDSAEGNLFLKALEVCGKNFATIKKDFFPWKPVKNLIDYYYCGQKAGGVGGGAGEGLHQQLPVSGSNGHRKSCDRQATSALPYPSPQAKPLAGQTTEVVSRGSRRVKEEEEEEEEEEIVIVSAKPPPALPAGPVTASPAVAPPPSSLSASGNRDTVGSLKFYLDGQMVLKLNARQGSSGECGDASRCRWVQSKDKCQKPPRVLRRKRRKRQVNGDSRHRTSTERGSSDSDLESGESAVKKKMLVPCVTTVVSPKPAWTPPVEKDLKCVDSTLCEDSLSLQAS